MAVVRHLEFLKVWYFDKLRSFAGLICVIMQNYVKIGQTVSEISRFFIFKMAAVRHHQNLSNGCWDIAFNIFQNGGRPPSWMFKSLIFWSAGNLWRINMCHRAKFRQNWPNGFWDIVIFDFQDGRCPRSCILKFFNFWFPIRLGRLRCIILPNFNISVERLQRYRI